MTKPWSAFARGCWLLIVCVVIAALLVQVPNTPVNQGLVFLVLWTMLAPILTVVDGERKWGFLLRGVVAAFAAGVLADIRTRVFGDKPVTLLSVITFAVLVVAIIGVIVEYRRSRQQHN